ncbi:hypothetical protein [Bacteroides acidifaciens]|uniref:hypothetical protein n=1 Tax=Bacteroides acidifaciens TaxID=85831 RepID=UPI0025A9B46E|nr:hypothetical protein [Bacteroides acidifaciens]
MKFIMAGLLASIGIATQAQDTKTEEPKGKAIVQVFGNFHTGLGAENDDRGFELERSYLGYEYKLGNGLSVKGVMDIGKSSDVSDYQRIAYIKKCNGFVGNGKSDIEWRSYFDYTIQLSREVLGLSLHHEVFPRRIQVR